jgi:predicted permease
MKFRYIQEIILSLMLAGLLVFFVNPMDFWMPSDTDLMIVFGAIIIYAFFAVFVWKEKARDEREEEHKKFAGHIAFVVGTGLLIVGLLVQHFEMKMLDPWLVYTLAGMVMAKVLGRIYSDLRR